MDPKKITASSFVSAVIGAVITEIKYGLLIGILVAGALLVLPYIRRDRSTVANRSSSVPDDIASMSDLTVDAIRSKLEHPDIHIDNIDTDDGGAWFVNTVFNGNKQNLYRIIRPHFDVKGQPMESNEGTHARLIPNLEAWSSND